MFAGQNSALFQRLILSAPKNAAAREVLTSGDGSVRQTLI